MKQRHIAADAYPWPYNGDLRAANTALVASSAPSPPPKRCARCCNSPLPPQSLFQKCKIYDFDSYETLN